VRLPQQPEIGVEVGLVDHLLLLNGLFSFLGVLLCYVGVFLVLPITFAAIATAYEQVFGLAAGEAQPYLPPPPPTFI